MSLITSIQKYSIHDGDGIRTTVFFKGCGLRCVWCHNPETQSYKKQPLVHQDRCVGCRNCELDALIRQSTWKMEKRKQTLLPVMHVEHVQIIVILTFVKS